MWLDLIGWYCFVRIEQYWLLDLMEIARHTTHDTLSFNDSISIAGSASDGSQHTAKIWGRWRGGERRCGSGGGVGDVSGSEGGSEAAYSDRGDALMLKVRSACRGALWFQGDFS